MIQVVSFKKIIDWDIELKIFIVKTMIGLTFEIDNSDTHTKMLLIDHDTLVLLQIVILRSEVQYLGTISFFLVLYFVDVVTKEQ